MSILIKGMNIPELYETYKVNFAMTNDGKIVMGMCPLNETGYRPVGEVVILPDHHGRLVDADEILVSKEECYYASSCEECRNHVSCCADMEGIIRNAPTIVEAEDNECRKN